jgi:hypothetical protein
MLQYTLVAMIERMPFEYVKKVDGPLETERILRRPEEFTEP